MALGIDDVYLTLLVLVTLIGLVFLWYTLAKSRYRRQSITQTVTIRDTFQSPAEMSREREGIRGEGSRREGLDSGTRGALIGGGIGPRGAMVSGGRGASVGGGNMGGRGTGREGSDSLARGAIGEDNEAREAGILTGTRENSKERRRKRRRGKNGGQRNDDGQVNDNGLGEASGSVREESSGERKLENWASQDIVVKVSQRTGEKFTFFWGPGTVFSQWYPAKFVVGGVEYNCAEQYMMYQKAVLFGDLDIAKYILESKSPKEQKAMGRQVQNFDVEIWNSNCKRIVREGNLAKFGQNDELREHLLATEGSTLVEASPFDRIWGIGLASDNPKATERRNWKGTNWLGEVLTQVRDELLKQPHSSL